MYFKLKNPEFECKIYHCAKTSMKPNCGKLKIKLEGTRLLSCFPMMFYVDKSSLMPINPVKSLGELAASNLRIKYVTTSNEIPIAFMSI